VADREMSKRKWAPQTLERYSLATPLCRAYWVMWREMEAAAQLQP